MIFLEIFREVLFFKHERHLASKEYSCKVWRGLDNFFIAFEVFEKRGENIINHIKRNEHAKMYKNKIYE